MDEDLMFGVLGVVSSVGLIVVAILLICKVMGVE